MHRLMLAWSAGLCLLGCTPIDPDHVPHPQLDGAAADAPCGLWYADCDGDGHAVVGADSMEACREPAPSACGGGWTLRMPTESTHDCDDGNGSVSPTHPEVPDNGADDNCDGKHGCWVDRDDDHFSEDNGEIRDDSDDADCDGPGEGDDSEERTDCDDDDAAIHPGAMELADNGIDENCNERHGCYFDEDGDGYRAMGDDVRDDSLDAACDGPGEASADQPASDCDDGDPDATPVGTEVIGDPDDADEDCDGTITCYVDADGDGSRTGVETSATATCAGPGTGYAADPEDCDDTEMSVCAGCTELCNTADEDCDGETRNGCPSAEVTLPAPTYSTAVGGTTGTSADSECGTGTALIGVEVWVAGGVVEGIRAVCVDVGVAETPTTGEYTYALAWAGAETPRAIRGRSTGTMAGANCPSGMFVSGIDVYVATSVHQLRLDCARYPVERSGTGWSADAIVENTAGPIGGTGGTMDRRTCSTPTTLARGLRVTTVSCGGEACLESIALGCAEPGIVPQ